ncbi:MAG TPA: CoA transferase [Acidimicrobiales bacterium]|nr:CoA transferase [Acidimicrobiales bacterium]
MTICDGWSVLELGTGSIASSLIGMMLADNGARVLKVEPPTGDRLRSEWPSGFLVWNRGKESAVADLRTDEGRVLVRDWARHADVLVAGASGEKLAQWGLAYEDLTRSNPLLVHCSVSGFGPTGAYSSVRAYEAVVAAKAGLFARGDFGFRPGPIFFNAPWGSLGAAHLALAGILAALQLRESTGRGQRIDATLAQGLSALDYFGTMHWQYARQVGAQPQVIIGQGGGPMAATRTMQWMATKDSRFITTTGMLPKEKRALARAAGVEHILDDPRSLHAPKFATAEEAQAWEDLFWEAFRSKTLDEWLPILRADPDIAFEAAVTAEEALDHPQMVHNGEVVEIDDPRHGPVRMIGPVARFEKSPSVIGVAPDLGANAGPLTGPAPVSAREPAPAHALSGVTIVECGHFFAMPFALTLAAALGARVIKTEGPDGDPFRLAFGAPETTSVRVMEGKESLSIDLQHPAGREVMHRLISQADVFVTSFRPGVPQHLGLDYQTLKALNPKLVYVYAAGYGVDGPYSNRAMYATSAQAAVGGVARHAAEWLDPELTLDWGVMELEAIIKPRIAAPVDGDSNAALSVLSAIMLGLTHQRRTGEGQHVASSMLAGNALCYSDDFCRYRDKPPLLRPDPESYGLGAVYRLYRAADDWVFLAAPTEREWADLVKALGAPQLAADERFGTLADRQANDDALAKALGQIISTRAAAELETALTAVGVGCVVAYEGGSSAFTSTDPVLLETGLTLQVDHPIFGRIVRHGLPVSLSETPGRVGPSALRGQHTELVLADVGYSPDEIHALLDAAAVFGPD